MSWIKIWNFLDGKKRNIAHLYWIIAGPVMLMWFPEGAPDTLAKIMGTIGIILSGFGYGHAAIKGAKK